MLDSIENRTKLSQLSKGEFIWAMVKCNLFKIYSPLYGDKSETYFGHNYGDTNADYDDKIYVFQMAAIPQVHKPMKMSLAGKMVNSEMKDDICYVFCSDLNDASRGEYRFSQYIFRPYSRLCEYPDTIFLSHNISYDSKKVLDIKNVFFTKKECIEACRKENNKQYNSRMLDLIKRTLNDAKKQLKDFMASELYIDYEKIIANELKIAT